MQPARYTEAKLDPICNELFADIDKDTVDFAGQLRREHERALPCCRCAFPSYPLVNSNIGIAVSMASAICPFNLEELCDTTIALMKNPDHDLSDDSDRTGFSRRRVYPLR